MKLILNIIFFFFGLLTVQAQNEFNYKEIFRFESTIDKTKWRLPNHDSIAREFITYLKKTDRYFSLEDYDTSGIYSIRFSYHLNLIIHESGIGAAPVDFYTQNKNEFNFLGESDDGPEYLKNIQQSENGEILIYTYFPAYVGPYVSESVWKNIHEGLYLYKKVNSVECIQLPDHLFEKPLKALTIKKKNSMHESPKMDKAICANDLIREDLNEENTFSFFQKNSNCKLLAESKDHKGNKWYFVEISMRDSLDEYRYTENYNDFYIGWMKSSDLKLLK